MLTFTTTHPATVDAVLAAGRGGGRAPIWMIGWLVVLGAIVAGVLYVTRRRDRRRSNADDERGNPR